MQRLETGLQIQARLSVAEALAVAADGIATDLGLAAGEARYEARALLREVVGVTPETMIAHGDRVLSPDQLALFREGLKRRLAREPISRIAGHRAFYGRSFLVTPAVLDPRPDSETLIDVALAEHARWLTGEPPRILDVGTGSGCLLATVLAEVPAATGVGLEISQAAACVARQNLQALGLADRATILVHDANLGPGPISGPFNLVLSNPPYIADSERMLLAPEVRDHDPDVALFADEAGLACYGRWLSWMPDQVGHGGMILEIGHRQGAAVTKIVNEACGGRIAGAVGVHQDLGGRDRCVSVWMRSEAP